MESPFGSVASSSSKPAFFRLHDGPLKLIQVIKEMPACLVAWRK